MSLNIITAGASSETWAAYQRRSIHWGNRGCQ